MEPTDCCLIEDYNWIDTVKFAIVNYLLENKTKTTFKIGIYLNNIDRTYLGDPGTIAISKGLEGNSTILMLNLGTIYII